jgi:hypothetical protein
LYLVNYIRITLLIGPCIQTPAPTPRILAPTVHPCDVKIFGLDAPILCTDFLELKSVMHEYCRHEVWTYCQLP